MASTNSESANPLQRKVVIKITNMKDLESRQKAVQIAADFRGVHFISANIAEQKLTVTGNMDAQSLVEKLAEKFGSAEYDSVGPD